ncbi:hypothetical protein [Streptomyces caniscabiei]|uniref:Amidohydrolase n=1 Tax=Streptomyces caniscabiei TaxID=2746961 RepID=A0ABU4N4Y7_9ACTN|nr:hypothetical protein [Streptomyces caniscabiei]MDX2946499.1 hypothetical protein [Streptomyces caniscabiei]MDX2956969.1 hypothetical protein [Streptomyces caniscabiei]MDX2989038.1 hypothetical protein [Streptomyces caniscabiei]MDX3013887.1 hypothetical protein [Streptomyces caniscabiei]MDX3044027.1 hypothetical protein [Streptomyces caniscabiei]
MSDGESVVDAHVHAPRLSTLKPAWFEWADTSPKPRNDGRWGRPATPAG